MTSDQLPFGGFHMSSSRPVLEIWLVTLELPSSLEPRGWRVRAGSCHLRLEHISHLQESAPSGLRPNGSCQTARSAGVCGVSQGGPFQQEPERNVFRVSVGNLEKRCLKQAEKRTEPRICGARGCPEAFCFFFCISCEGVLRCSQSASSIEEKKCYYNLSLS